MVIEILIFLYTKTEIALITNGCSTKLTTMVAHQIVDDHPKVPEVTEINETQHYYQLISIETQLQVL